MDKSMNETIVKRWMVRKAAVAGSEVSDFEPESTVDPSDYFLASLEHDESDLLNRIIASARFASFSTRTGIPSTPTVAHVVNEGASVPVTNFSMSFSALTPHKTAALAVISNEVLRGDPRSLDTLYRDLREGVTLATDAAIIDILKSGLTPITSTNSPAQDIHRLLDEVNLTGFGSLLLIVSPRLVNAMATAWPYSDENDIFKDCTATGGSVCGVRIYVSAAMNDEEILLVDVKGLLAGPQTVDLKLSNQTMIEMDSEPTGDSGTPTAANKTMVSMFQSDCSAFRATRHFAVKVVRPSSVALINDVVWEAVS